MSCYFAILSFSNELQVTFPDNLSPQSGEVIFYGPSDKSKDKEFDLGINLKEQKFNIDNFEKGLWKVKINWKSNETEYKFEDSFFL